MQARRLARLSHYRLTGLAVVIALTVGILIGGHVDVTGALSEAASSQHEPAALSTQAVTPIFIVGDADGLYHQQQATEAAISACSPNGSPVFIGGDIDGLANPAVNAVIPTARCYDIQH